MVNCRVREENEREELKRFRATLGILKSRLYVIPILNEKAFTDSIELNTGIKCSNHLNT